MLTRLGVAAMLIACYWSANAVEERHGFLVGEVLKLDARATAVVIKSVDGAEHTLHFVKRTTVHGATGIAADTTDLFKGLKEGAQVVAHYTARGAVETAEEIDHIGKDGLKTIEATVTHIDRDAKTLTLKTADGAEETYRLTDRAAKNAGNDITIGAEKSAKATVYYTEEGGRKIAHFFKRVI